MNQSTYVEHIPKHFTYNKVVAALEFFNAKDLQNLVKVLSKIVAFCVLQS